MNYTSNYLILMVWG